MSLNSIQALYAALAANEQRNRLTLDGRLQGGFARSSTYEATRASGAKTSPAIFAQHGTAGRKLPLLGVRETGQNAFRGQIQDIGVGGICLLSDRSIPQSSLVRCEIDIPGVPATIPTLMQARWIQTGSNKIDLQFLL